MNGFLSLVFARFVGCGKYVFCSLLVCCFLVGNLHGGVPIHYEMRGVWVATVNNIDWPSRKGLDTASQQAEALKIISQSKALGLNAIFLQVRPVADALYQSPLEPWSAFLTGKEGQAPEPFYDPLQFWVENAHEFGLELHAWINPFRASLPSNNALKPSNAMLENPSWLVPYGPRHYFDPGIPEAREYLLKVVADLVNRYDIDGLHLDDYFYPYPIPNETFNDDRSYKVYGNGMPRDQWRRNNIDTVINSLNRTIKDIKPWVKFGVSPFGVWRNKATDPTGSDTRAGVECYDDLHADILLWEREGWIDYVIPQIYWTTKDVPANYTKLLDWWNAKTLNRHLYIGHALYKVNASTKFWENPSELPNQLILAKDREQVRGGVFFSMVHFFRQNLLGFADSLVSNFYNQPALTPSMDWISTMPPKPVTNIQVTGNLVSWERQGPENATNEAKRFVVYLEPVNLESSSANPVWFVTGKNHFELPIGTKNQKDEEYNLIVLAIDRLSNQSKDNPVVRFFLGNSE